MIEKRATSLIVSFALIVALLPSAHVNALPTHETIYTVYYTSVVGPPPGVVGEWVSDCANQWYGWGWEPGHAETETEITQGDPCS